MSLSSGYFDAVYADSDDPWGFGHRFYERRKRAVLLASLPREHFEAAFEPGCSTGELTVALAERCGSVWATDIAARPIAVARHRTAGLANVRVDRRVVPDEWPHDTPFDLVVLSEVGYYLDEGALRRLLDVAVGSLTPSGVLVTCHWRHPAPDYPLRGDSVAEIVADHATVRGLSHLVGHVEEDFRLDVHGAPGTRSVARTEGLV